MRFRIMRSLTLLVLVLNVATSSPVPLNAFDYEVDIPHDEGEAFETVETFGTRGSGFSESSFDNPNDPYYRNERTRIAREVPAEEGSSPLDSDLLIDIIEERTGGPNLKSVVTPFPKTVSETTKQVTHANETFKGRSLLSIDL